jgi:thiamine biosynthesis lipoprotein
MALYFSVFLLGSWGFDRYARLKEISASQYALHTLTEIKVLCRNERRGRQAILAAFQRIKELEEKFNYFSPSSELSNINKNAYAAEVKLSPDMHRILEQAVAGSRSTDGAFDITVTPVTRLYGFGTDSRRAPDAPELRQKIQSVGWQNIKLDAEKQTARLLNKDTLLDLGGLAKGYAVDEAVQTLRQHGITDALVNAGGNIYALGLNRGQKWRIGIRRPRAAADSAQIIELNNEACATSGDYEQYFLDASQRRISHIFNPRTGRPANLENGLASVTVIAATAARADLLSTACFVLGEEKSKKIAEKKYFYRN